MTIDREGTKKWRISGLSRFIGIIVWTLFILFTIDSVEDTWFNAIFKVSLVIMTFFLVVVIPDKLMLGKRLVGTYSSKTSQMKQEGKKK